MTRPYVPLFAAVRHSTKLADLSDHAARVLYFMLLPQYDAWGRMARDPRVVDVEAWPMLRAGPWETERCLQELERVGLIETRTDGALTWIQVPDWEEKGGSVGRRDNRPKSKWPEATGSSRSEPVGAGRSRSEPVGNGTDQSEAVGASRLRARGEGDGEERESETEKETDTQSSAIAERCAVDVAGKPPPTHPHGRLIRAYTDAYEATYGKKCPFTSRQARSAQQVLELAHGDVEVAIRVIRAAFADPFWVEKGLTIGQLATGWDRFVAIANKPPPKPKLTQAQQAVMNAAASAARGEVHADPFERLLP